MNKNFPGNPQIQVLKSGKTGLFTNYIYKAIPLAFDESMSYYETLLGLLNYLKNVVIPTVNNNADAVVELQNLYIQLHDYVEHYFENLDVQEEINNKLDEMVRDGTLQEILEEIIVNKLDYYEITTQTNEELQNILDKNSCKIISFMNDYTSTTTLNLNENTTILLNNHKLTFDIPNYNEDFSASHGFYNFKTTDAFLGYNGNGNIKILNGTIEGGNLSFCHANNIDIENIHFLNCQNNHILEMAGINNLKVNSCTFDGIAISENIENNYLEYIQIDYMQYTDFPWFDENSATYDGTINQNWSIENNDFVYPENENYTFYNAIGNHNFINNMYHKNINIINNTFTNMTNSGIVYFNLEKSLIKGNTFIRNNASTIEGAMIVLRSVSEDITIEDNIFSGNYSAIQCLRMHYNKHNLKIRNNKFINYSNTTNPIIHLYNIFDAEINDNTFTDFVYTAIRVDAHLNDGNYNGKYYIFNNKFISSQTLLDSVVKTYCGYAYVYNNIFNVANNSAFYAIALPNSTDETLYDAIIYNNDITGFSEKEIHLHGNNPSNIKDIYFKLYSGNVTTLTNQSLSYDLTKFNTIYITFGGGAGTTTKIIKPWAITGKFDTDRTYRFTTTNSSSELLTMFLVINADGTINYSTNGSSTYCSLRQIIARNE